MKKIFIIVLLSIFGIVGNSYYHIFGKKKEYNQRVIIEKNISVMKSLDKIIDKNDIIFKIYMKTKNGGRNIKAGVYSINGKYSINELIEIFESGRGRMVKVTIPEGYSIKEIIELLEKKGEINGEKFYQALKEYEERFPYPIPNGNFEGYLYPETYFLSENYSEKELVSVMLGEFLKKFPSENYPNKDEFYKKLIMASILEREAQIKSEKPLMASVFYNRIKKNMTLSSDATVNFLYDYKKRRMYYKDLEIDSPYNTYKYKGLPPAPICNPAIDSVESAYNPADTEYLFFVAKGDGGHFFSKTYREHLEFQKRNKEQK